MAYSTYETSAEERTPVELYEIAVGDTEYFFTSAGEEYDSLGHTYEPLAGLSHGNFQESQESRQNILKVTMPASHEFPQKYVRIVPGNVATLSIFAIHWKDGGTPERVLQWTGAVQSVAFSLQGHLAEISLRPTSNLSRRMIPRDTYQGLCNNDVYGLRCKVAESSFLYTGTVSAVVLDVITVDGLNAAKGGDWAVGGFLTNATRDDYRMIIDQTVDSVTVIRPFPTDISVLGEDFEVVAGCDHSLATCKSKFNNVENFRGFAFVPWRNFFVTGI